MEKKDLDKIINQFSKITETQEINPQGVGLGLSISNRLVNLLGPVNNNKIEVESEIGVGTQFSFVI